MKDSVHLVLADCPGGDDILIGYLLV
jgi:hypothetical protein